MFLPTRYARVVAEEEDDDEVERGRGAVELAQLGQGAAGGAGAVGGGIIPPRPAAMAEMRGRLRKMKVGSDGNAVPGSDSRWCGVPRRSARALLVCVMVAGAMLAMAMLAFMFVFPDTYLGWIGKSGAQAGQNQNGQNQNTNSISGSGSSSSGNRASAGGGSQTIPATSPTAGPSPTTDAPTAPATAPPNKTNANSSFFLVKVSHTVAPGTSMICYGPVLFHPADTATAIEPRAMLIEFIPRVNMDIVHHMVLFGSTDAQLSDADAKVGPSSNPRNPCWNDAKSKVVYSWARVGQTNGLSFRVPEGSGIDVGARASGATYTSFFLNVHYENRAAAKQNVPDASGFELQIVPRPLPPDVFTRLSVVWLHSEAIHLTPQKEDVVVCREFTARTSPDMIDGISKVVAYREHGHLNARMFYTDVFRHGKIRVGRIGERTAQDAQIYYLSGPDKPAVYIREGDMLRLRCHYNTMDKTKVITYSASELDGEMCNQYLMGTIALSPGDRGRACNTGATDAVSFGTGEIVQWQRMPALGEIASLALLSSSSIRSAPTKLWVFHRSDKTFWNKTPIEAATIVSGTLNGAAHFRGTDPSLFWGAKQFIVPHGLYLDRWDFLWVTDTALHQVFRIRASTGEAVLTLGTAKKPGNDGAHFNQPTDVALSPDGLLAYISDGYGNSRVAVFATESADTSGAPYAFSHAWGSFGNGPGQFDTPHSIAVDVRGRVYVADRHNARVQVFAPRGPVAGSNDAPLAVWQATGVIPWATLSPAQKTAAAGKGPDGSTWLYHVTALCYEPYLDVLFVIEGADLVMRSVAGEELQRIDGSDLRWPHDIEATLAPDKKSVVVYVAELKGKRVRQYQILL